MKPKQQPSREAVRDFMASRQKQQTPPPSIEEVRRQLGWGLNPANKAGNR